MHECTNERIGGVLERMSGLAGTGGRGCAPVFSVVNMPAHAGHGGVE